MGPYLNNRRKKKPGTGTAAGLLGVPILFRRVIRSLIFAGREHDAIWRTLIAGSTYSVIPFAKWRNKFTCRWIIQFNIPLTLRPRFFST
jgi:hypothetical protein